MRLLLLAVALAVAALTAVSFFANRIERGLTRDAAQLLGGDVVVVADQPIEPAWIEEAHRQGLRTSRTWVFPSMARAPDERGGESRLVALKAVDEAYPLRGRMTIATADAQGRVGEPRPAPAGGPPVGELWVDPNVLDGLGVQLGDALWMGEVALRVTAVIVSEPDRGAGFVNFSPRVMMNQADLARTELIQPASRVTYRVLVASAARASDATRDTRTGQANEAHEADRATEPTGAEPAKPVTGSDAAVQAYTRWVQAQAETTRGARVETLEQGQPQMRTTLDRASLFLRLVALLAALLSAVAVAVVARDFAMRRLDDCALLRVFGVPQSFMAKAYALQFLGVGVMASVLGSLLGWAFHLVFVWLLGNLVSVSLPAAGLAPWLLGLSVGVLLTLGFGLPSVLQLAQVPPLRVLRRDLGEPRAASWTVAGLGLLALIGLLLSVAGDLQLGALPWAALPWRWACLPWPVGAWPEAWAAGRGPGQGVGPRG